ncbi:hypothetical protein [Poseidonocella sp. HB161398]|uniref:hypothetical protein n=1 Tax=Poseidonocella sp. HB161398 TaxID=2320855 RepID=UPI0011098CFD|nr:hypothetical protein [Poseidonocella sp. HB161398]
MGLKKLAAKLAEYRSRQERGNASEIRPDHVARILDKLHRKKSALAEAIADGPDGATRERLEHKLAVASEQIARAEWLMEELGRTPPSAD